MFISFPPYTFIQHYICLIFVKFTTYTFIQNWSYIQKSRVTNLGCSCSSLSILFLYQNFANVILCLKVKVFFCLSHREIHPLRFKIITQTVSRCKFYDFSHDRRCRCLFLWDHGWHPVTSQHGVKNFVESNSQIFTPANNVWFEKTGTIRCSVLLLRIVPVFLKQTLHHVFDEFRGRFAAWNQSPNRASISVFRTITILSWSRLLTCLL